MPSDDKYIDKPDDFSREVGEKLREHQMPVSSDVWDLLTDKFPPRERRISAHWSWVAAGVAAVALLLLFLLNPSVDEPLLTGHSQLGKQIKQGAVVPEINTDDIESRTDEKADLKQIVKANSEKPEKIIKPEGISAPAETTESKEITTSETITDPGKDLYPDEPVKPETEVLPVEELFAENDFSFPVKEERKQQSLIAALGSGGTLLDISFGGSGDKASHDSPIPGGEFNDGIGLGSGNKYYLLTPNDYTDIEHRPPVSFSLTTDFPVGKYVSLETGLSYTYLFSRFRRNDHFIYRGTLRQHYIGIPVNMRYTIWQDDAWNIYLLAGGSIEKGLRSVYKQDIEYNGGVVYHTDVYSRIDGFQFSAQGGAGFSYRLHNNLNLFGEPRVIYYFKNNQPMSARTENPFIFGLNMGVRIQFK